MLHTDRLLLREFTLDDVEAYFLLCTNPDVVRYTGGSLGVHTLADALVSLRDRPIADYRKHGFGRWACVLRSSGQVIGFAGLKYLEDLKEVDIGYRLLPEHWGVGLATEASRAALSDGFTRLKLLRVIALVDLVNTKSARVLQKLGLTYVDMIEYFGDVVARYAIDAPVKL